MSVYTKYNETRKAYYHKNRERILEKRRLYRKNNREAYNKKRRNQRRKKYKAVVERLGAKCVECGYSDFRALVIHHKEQAPKTNGKRVCWDFLKKDFDYNKVKLLCANCHKIEHWGYVRKKY